MEQMKLVESWSEETVKGDESGTLEFLRDPSVVLSQSWFMPTDELKYLVYEKGASLTHREPLTGHTPLHSAAEAGSEEHVRWFLANGAPWNMKDNVRHTPAELALEEGHKKIHDIIFQDAVIKEWQRFYEPRKEQKNEWLLDIDRRDICNDRFLKQTRILYTDPRPVVHSTIESFAMLDDTGTGVMMEWERPIMKETARLLFDGMKRGIECLNIGFGMGIIDTYFQEHEPAQHTIIEAHPDALIYMKKMGWYDKPNVQILEGRWQDFVGIQSPSDLKTPGSETLAIQGLGCFDIVYFDTYEEGYRGYMQFWKYVPGLLRGPGSRLSFFHGHGRKTPFLYKLFSEVARWHLNDLGLNTDWHDVYVDPKTVWYSHKDTELIETGKMAYRESHPHQVPICTLAPTIPRKVIPGCGWASTDRD